MLRNVTGSSYDDDDRSSGGDRFHSSESTLDFAVEDDLSSVSDISISRDQTKPSFGRRKDRRQERCEPTSVPFEVFVPLCLDAQTPEEETGYDDRREEDIIDPVQEPSTEESGDLEDLVEAQPAARKLDPESQARLQAIHQLASMMGSDHPDVLFSMEYLGKHLYRRGDIGGAEAIQNHVQERRNILRQATINAFFTANPQVEAARSY